MSIRRARVLKPRWNEPEEQDVRSRWPFRDINVRWILNTCVREAGFITRQGFVWRVAVGQVVVGGRERFGGDRNRAANLLRFSSIGISL